MKKILFATTLMLACTLQGIVVGQTTAPARVLPSAKQLAYQELEMVGFVHFNMNTFTDKEWGYGDESPTLFNPVKLDCEQWAKAAREAGLKELILTAKHHDGFCLWPSAYTEHSVKFSPYKNGKGDIVKEFTEACAKYGLKAGLYLSPWDRNHADYGKAAYTEYYKKQLTELLSNYGKITEVWFDGANGGDGYYGGAREVRKIDKLSYYPWKEIREIVYRLQAEALIFSDAGPDIHWIGNERGIAGETFWSTIDPSGLVVGDSDSDYLNTGDYFGTKWMVGQCDVSIRKGWFFHNTDDETVKTPAQLVDLYYKSVGRNAVFLLNIPPNRDGLFADKDVANLKKFRQILDNTFKNNLIAGAKVTASSSAAGSDPSRVTDHRPDTYWKAGSADQPVSLEIPLDATKKFDRILLQEPVSEGQHIASFDIQILRAKGWQTIAAGTSIGYKRLLRITPITGSRLRLNIRQSREAPALSEIGLFKAAEGDINF
ncbi:MAG: alpha-L-fucosidase [Marinilabiliales bacterium]|nr:alpha-L-fucosidase [Marinilabiliales bacterium]